MTLVPSPKQLLPGDVLVYNDSYSQYGYSGCVLVLSVIATYSGTHITFLSMDGKISWYDLNESCNIIQPGILFLVRDGTVLPAEDNYVVYRRRLSDVVASCAAQYKKWFDKVYGP